MIQIIKGTFGYYNGRKVIPITEADGPQKFDDELEARLVKEGVAKYIGELGETAEQPAPAPGDDAEQQGRAGGKCSLYHLHRRIRRLP